MTIFTWEKSLPRTCRVEESRWEEILAVPDGWLRDPELQVFPPPSFPAVESCGVTVASEMRAICSWYARKSAYRRTSDYNALNATEQRTVDIMLQRFGINGESESTLQQIGDRLGITRERVRQISDDFLSSLGTSTPIEAPAVARLKAAIQPALPCRVEILDSLHRDLLGDALSLIGADRFTREILGRSIVRISTKPGNMQGHPTPMALHDDLPEDSQLREVRQVAVTMIRTCGAAQVHFIAGMASANLRIGITPADVSRCCRSFDTFEWLSEQDGWFWFGPAMDNRAKTTALKVLAVATRNVDVEEIHDAMARARLLRYDPSKARPYLIDTPQIILREVIARLPGVEKVQFNDFRLADPIAPESVLSDTELAVLEVLRRHGGVATRQTIVDEVLASLDVTPMALNFTLDGSPILVRLDRGVWGLRGCDMNAYAVSSALERNSAGGGGPQRYFRDAAPENGWWTFRVAVPQSAFERRHWLVPVAVAELLQPGEYVVEGYEERAQFFVGANGNLAGFVAKLISSGIAPNEEFSIGIHATERRIRFEKFEGATA